MTATVRWSRRAAGAAVAFGLSWLGLHLAELDPDAGRLALLVAACVVLLGLLVDALGEGSPAWDIEVERPSVREGGDQRLAQYVAMLEEHRTGHSVTRSLQDRLDGVVEQLLVQRHGITRRGPRAEEVLGPDLVAELAAVLDGPARRLDPARIDHLLTRIEEL